MNRINVAKTSRITVADAAKRLGRRVRGANGVKPNRALALWLGLDAAGLTYDADKFERWFAGKLYVEEWATAPPVMLSLLTSRGQAALWVGNSGEAGKRAKGRVMLFDPARDGPEDVVAEYDRVFADPELPPGTSAITLFCLDVIVYVNGGPDFRHAKNIKYTAFKG